ncbi:hypothetical protein ACEXQD_17450 [Herbiconiux sp. P15]|uniref:hypothetical protein n=1 Tax=Herbiconiux liukaitaii TaxID=3342799 RepID=UPI0035B9789B
MREIVVSVDYGQGWPLSDITWMPEDKPDWPSILSPELIERLDAWGDFFDKHADEETSLFGSEELRRWFDLEGVRLRDALEREAGHLYSFRLSLWF